MSSETESFVGERAGLGEDLLHLAAFRTLVLERVHDLIAVLDLEGRVVVASPSWTRLGWEPDELVGQPILDLLHPEDLERGATALGSALSGASVDTVLVRLRRRDGGWFSVDASGAPIRDAAGEVACVLGIGRDVSEREELRQRVTEVDALYRIAEAISRATALDELFEEAIDTLVAATGADHAAILLYDDADVLRFRAWRGLSDAFRAAAAGHAPWPQDAEEPEPVLVADVTEGGFSPELERAVRAEGIAALAFVPLVHGRRLLGTFVLYHDQPHRWQEREVRLCLTIATHLASATIRTRARNALRASREQLETILRTVDEGIVVQARDGRLVYANAAAARLIGFQTAEELLAAEPQDVLSRFELFDERGEPLEASSLPSRRAFDGESAELLTLYRRLGGDERRWSVIRANPVRSDTGEVELVVSVIHDVTAPKRAEEEAAASVRRVRFLARASELLSETLRYEETLGALARLAVPGFAGHVTVDLYEDGVLRCVAARHVDPEKTVAMVALREEYPPTVGEHPVQRALVTGAVQFVRDVQAEAESMAHDERHAAAIRDLGNTSGIVVPLVARGRTLGAITFGTVPPQPDFTEADVELASELGRRASLAIDNALLFEEARERAHAAEALEFVDDGVFLVDRDEIVRLWNPAAEKTLRVRASQAIGRNVAEVIQDWATLRDRVRVVAEPTAASRTLQALPVDVQGEERWLSLSAVRFPGGTVYAFRDLTDERAVDQMKTDFVSTVSHELRTPLAAIYGAALTLQREDIQLEESQRRGLLDVIAGEADRLARIVNDILWASRLDSGQLGIAIESCDAAALATKVVDALGSHAPPEISLELAAPADLPPVSADPDKLRQILTNLVDNAVKYSPDGGRVRVTVGQAGSRVRFRVSDQGLGIPLAEQGRIFEKFFRLDPNLTRGVGGTGLGLYICRELVHRMQGRIWVVSDGRSGSDFFVELPVVSDAA